MFSLVLAQCTPKILQKSGSFLGCTDDNTWNPSNHEEDVVIGSKVFSLGPKQFACMRGDFVLESKDRFIAYIGNESSTVQFSNPFYMHPDSKQDMDIIKLTCAESAASCKIQAVTVFATDIGDETETSSVHLVGIFSTRSNVTYGYECRFEENEKRSIHDCLRVVSFGPNMRTMNFTADNNNVIGHIYKQSKSSSNPNSDFVLGLIPLLEDDGNQSLVKSKFDVTIETYPNPPQIDCLFDLEKTYVLPNKVVSATKQEVEENSKKYNYEILPPSPLPTPTPTEKPRNFSQLSLAIIISQAVIIVILILIVIFFAFIYLHKPNEVTKSDAAIAQLI